MALRATFSNLFSHRFRTSAAAPMQWMRQISTNNVIQQDDVTTPAVMPAVLATGLSSSTGQELSTSLEPYSGRSIGNVSNSQTAYRKLSSILAQNNVRRELRANRYYEKPNVTRRRKNIERNRKLFGAMIGKKVALIMQMKQRGM